MHLVVSKAYLQMKHSRLMFESQDIVHYTKDLKRVLFLLSELVRFLTQMHVLFDVMYIVIFIVCRMIRGKREGHRNFDGRSLCLQTSRVEKRIRQLPMSADS